MTDGELRVLLEQAASETRRHFDVAAEAMRADLQMLGEGLGDRMDRLQTELDERFDEIKGEIEETKALIKLSYAQLDRRVESLERGHRELVQRIERLEADRPSH